MSINKVTYLVPTKALEIIEESFQRHNLLRARKLLNMVCQTYVIGNKHVPYCCFIRLSNENYIRPLEGKKRGFFQKEIVPLLFDTIPHCNYQNNKKPKGYRFKAHILQGGFVIKPFENFDEVNKTRLNQTIKYAKKQNLEFDKASFNEISYEVKPKLAFKAEKVKNCTELDIEFMRSLDYSDIHLDNKGLIDDLELLAEPRMKESIQTKNTKSGEIKICKISLKTKPDFKPLIIATQDKLDILIEAETTLIIERWKLACIAQSKVIHITRDQTTGRLHHNLTNSPSPLVKYLNLHGEQLVEIDLHNAHYTFLASILSGNHKRYFEEFVKYSPTLCKIYLSRGDNIKGKVLWCPPNPLQMSPSYPPDLQQFIDWSESGVLYDKCIDVFQRCADEQSMQVEFTRNLVKVAFMEVVYGKYNKSARFKGIFKKVFPTIYKIANELKRNWYKCYDDLDRSSDSIYLGVIHSVNKKSKSNYDAGNSALPIMLMNFESQLFVDDMLCKIRDAEIQAITKHDSILLKVSDYKQGLAIVEASLVEAFGVGRFALKKVA